jgi:glucokinase
MRHKIAQMKNILLGVDIGGTKVAAALVSSTGKVLYSVRTEMVPRKTAEEGLKPVFEAIDAVLADSRAKGIRAIGVSVPGWVDSIRGVLVGAPNIPCWRDFRLVREIERHYGLPVHAANDANAGALAESTWGAAAGCANVLYVTLGTGVGTGIVLQHRLYTGRTGAAGEGGHVTIDFRGPCCGCGKNGCIEMYVSGTAIARRARECIVQRGGRRSRMFTLAGGNIAAVKSETVAVAAKAGDPLARKILDEAADHFAIWLGNMIDLLDPEIIVVGGGVAKLMLRSMGRIRAGLKNWAVNPRQREIPVVHARYGSESAVAGAAALCLVPSKPLGAAYSKKRRSR